MLTVDDVEASVSAPRDEQRLAQAPIPMHRNAPNERLAVRCLKRALIASSISSCSGEQYCSTGNEPSGGLTFSFVVAGRLTVAPPDLLLSQGSTDE
jgi:hypothetical protein